MIELGKLFDTNCWLPRIFPNSPWPTATVNFGPQTVTFPHTNPGNLAFGWCCISTFGNFNFLTSDQIILWDLGLVIDFPPSSTIPIPPLTLMHSNTSIKMSEQQYSFTQYPTTSLFRWVSNRFCSDKTFLVLVTKEQVEEWIELRRGH